MMKVLYIIPRLDRGGVTQQLYYIIKNLDKNKISPYILTLAQDSGDSFVKDFEKLNVDIKLIKTTYKDIFVSNLKKIKKYVHLLKPDIIHSNGLRPDLVSKHLPITLLLTLHNYPYDDYPDKYGNIKGSIMAFLHLRLAKKIENTIACSKFIYNAYRKKLDIRLYGYIQNGVDTEKYQPASISEKEKLRMKMKVPLDKKIFLSVGALIGRKNPKTIVEAFLKRRKKNEMMIFLGKGELMKECKKMSEKSENIRFMEQVQNVSDYLKMSDYFISASHSEGLPNAVLEAMSCGLACILSDIPSHREIVECNKKIAFLFLANDSNRLNRRIDEILSIDCDKVSKMVKKSN